MISNNIALSRIQEIHPVIKNVPDDILITCGSFEERFLGVPQKLRGSFPKKFILFRFREQNEKREKYIEDMKAILSVYKYKDNYFEIYAEHGRSIDPIMQLNNFLQKENLCSRELIVTIDISTFTKELLINLMLYLNSYLQVTKVRLLYTLPGRYAAPEEGWLSSGIENVLISPLCWSQWTPVKDNLLITILGFEEMRAWALIDRFSADRNWVFVTSPGSVHEWDSHCEKFNYRLLNEIKPKDRLPALDPYKTSEVLSRYITTDLLQNYNIFVCPLGTKPQIIGVLQYYLYHQETPINIITTAVTKHNVPYYSWGLGDTFEFFFPTKTGYKNE